MKTKKYIIFGLIAISSIAVKAQFGGSGGAGAAPMAALNSGDVTALAKIKSVNIVYDYSDLGVGAFRKEADYISKHSEDMEKKEKGSSEKFKTDWVNARKTHYEPKFEEMFKKIGMKEINMDGTNYSTSSEYTLTVHTIFIEPGVNAGIYKKPSYIDMECTFSDKSGKALCVFYIKNAVGAQATGFDFAVESRLIESYAKAAKMLVLCIKKESKKK